MCTIRYLAHSFSFIQSYRTLNARVISHLPSNIQARKMALQDDGDKPKSKRVFINQVDAYQGKNIAKVIFVNLPGTSPIELQAIREERNFKISLPN